MANMRLWGNYNLEESVNLHNWRVSCTIFRPVSNHHALRTLARIGGGAFEIFDPKVKSKWEGKVKDQLSKVSQPGVSSISIAWQTFNEKKDFVQAPSQIMGLFNGCRQVIYGFVPDCMQVGRWQECPWERGGLGGLWESHSGGEDRGSSVRECEGGMQGG